MLGFKNFESASQTLAGIEMVRLIRKQQLVFPMTTTSKTFCSLAIEDLASKLCFSIFISTAAAEFEPAIYKR
jgi:hypothetical protein